MSVIDLLIIHRQLGSQDESASDEEQGEKILYSSTLSSLSELLSSLTLYEGLIEFTSKFSTRPIEDIILEGKTIIFFECEPSLWWIATFPPGGDVKAYRQSIITLYHTFHALFGPLTPQIDFNLISKLQLHRKAVRKGLSEDVIKQRWEEVEDGVTQGIHRRLPHRLTSFLSWYLVTTTYNLPPPSSSSNLISSISSPTCCTNAVPAEGAWIHRLLPSTPHLHPYLHGTGSRPKREKGSSSGAGAVVMKVKQATIDLFHKDGVDDLLRGVIVLQHGLALWSDLNDHRTNSSLLYLLSLLDGSCGANYAITAAAGGRAISQDEESEEVLGVAARCGVMGRDWRTIALDGNSLLHIPPPATVPPLPSPTIPPSLVDNKSGALEEKPSLAVFEALEGIAGCGGASKDFFSPRIYPSSSAAEPVQSLGRLLCLRLAHFKVAILLHEENLARYERSAILAAVEHYHTAGKACVPLQDFLGTLEKQAAGRGEGGEGVCTESNLISIQVTILAYRLLIALEKRVLGRAAATIPLRSTSSASSSSSVEVVATTKKKATGRASAPPRVIRSPSTPSLSSSNLNGNIVANGTGGVGAGGGGGGSCTFALLVSNESNQMSYSILRYLTTTNRLDCLLPVDLRRDYCFPTRTNNTFTANGSSMSTRSSITNGSGPGQISHGLMPWSTPSDYQLFYFVVAAFYGKAAVRTISSLWQNMQAVGGSHRSLCQRVSTAQRGGQWVFLKQVSPHRTVIAVMKGCATINEQQEAAEGLLRELRLLPF